MEDIWEEVPKFYLLQEREEEKITHTVGRGYESG